jgi:hypothetical protein
MLVELLAVWAMTKTGKNMAADASARENFIVAVKDVTDLGLPRNCEDKGYVRVRPFLCF